MTSRKAVLNIVVLLGAAACSAQDLKPGDTQLTAELVKTGLYLISGEGGNALLRLSANGLIVMDGERPGDYKALLEQVKRISDQPIRVRLNTGGRGSEDDSTLRIGGIEVQSMHFGNAHAGGNTVVYFPNLKVVAVGDLFAPAPDPDFSARGSLVDWAAALAQVLKLDFDVAVPGKGPTVSRADLEALKATIDTLVSRAAELSRTK